MKSVRPDPLIVDGAVPSILRLRQRLEIPLAEKKPKTTFLTCSDSPIDLSPFSNTPSGNRFVIRNAGNIVPEHRGSPGGAANAETARLRAVAESNVRLQVENLRKLDFVRAAEEEGRVQLHGWLYEKAENKVRVLSSAEDQPHRLVA